MVFVLRHVIQSWFRVPLCVLPVKQHFSGMFAISFSMFLKKSIFDSKKRG